MSTTPSFRALFWMDDWPSEAVLATLVGRLARSPGAAGQLESGGSEGWAGVPCEAGRLRAACRVGRGTSSGCRFRAGERFDLRLVPTPGYVAMGAVEGQLTSGEIMEVRQSMLEVDAQFGVVERNGEPYAAFRRVELAHLGEPMRGGEVQGAWIWWEATPLREAGPWLAAVVRRMRMGGSLDDVEVTGGEVRPSPVQALPPHVARPVTATELRHPLPVAHGGLPTYLQAAARTMSGVPLAEPEQVEAPSGVPSPARVSDPFPLSLTEPIHRDLIRASLARDAVPFEGATSPARLAELRKEALEADETALHPVRGPFHDAEPDADSTMMLPLAAMLGQTATPAFASSLGATPIPELTVDRYAALSAELEVKGPTPEVLRRYELPTQGALRALQDEQAKRMTSDPALKARFDERVAHFLRFLRPMETP